MIVIDNIAFYLQKSGGISVVWKELISYLTNEKSILYLEYKKMADNIFREKIDIPLTSTYYLKLFSLKIQRYLPLSLPFIKEPYIFHSSYYRYSLDSNAINITTVHDFTYEYYIKGIKSKLHSWQKNEAIRHSDYIICISENTKRDLLRLLPDTNPDKLRVIYNGVSDDYYPLLLDMSDGLPFEKEKYVLFVGSRIGYKNFDFTVEILTKLKYKLVIVGSPLTPKEKKILDFKLGNNSYYCVGRVSSEKLNILYNYAFALLYLSLYEGFGIPVLEAQKATCPVIACNSSSIPEIIGNTPLLLKQMSIIEVERCFRILEDPIQRNVVIQNGLENSKRFTWDRMSNQIKALYKEALEAKKS